jgi:hypothetical protein
MKKPLFYFVLLSSICINAQTTIVEEKFEKDNMPLSYDYLPESDKLIIEKGEYKSMSTNRMIKSINKFDINGKKEILAENAELMNVVFSSSENTFMVNEYSRLTLGKKFKYVVNGKSTPFIDISELKNSNHLAFRDQYFNDKYELGFTDEKSKKSIDFEKDDLFLEVTDIFTRVKNRYNVEKPDINRLNGNAFIKPDKNLGFAAIITNAEAFEIITKSISKDYKTTILYRTNYNMKGKKLDETSFVINLNNYFLIYSNNGGGFIGTTSSGANSYSIPIFVDDLSINNFLQDEKTGEVYIYGLFGEKSKGLNDDNSASGYYIFKFDKTGKKIWETINTIDDKKGFNKKIHLYRLLSNLTIKDNELYFRTGTDYNKEQIHEFFLDKNTGTILNKNKISFKEDKIYTLKGDIRYFLLSFYQYEGYKNKVFDFDGLVAIDTNIKVAQYLKNIDSKNKLYFNTIISNKGIWLIESDNEEYYKVTFFKA